MHPGSANSLHPTLFRYWAESRGARPMPSRADLDPLAMKAALPHLMLIDVVGEGFRYRLVGTQVVQDFGRDLTGKTVGQQLRPMPFAADVGALFARLRDRGVPVFTTGHHQTGDGVTHSVSRLLLPLGEDGRTSMIMICRLARYPRSEPVGSWPASAETAKSAIVDVATEAEVRALTESWEAESEAIAARSDMPIR
jgi:hypothetical protein